MPVIDFKKYCQQQGIKLTPLRTKVLDVLVKQSQPLTAYELLDLLKKDNPKAQVMTVYRILEFLQQHDLVHRIENLNAFMLCHHLSKHHISQWLICEVCGTTTEYAGTAFNQAIEEVEQHSRFQVSEPTIELLGVCHNCQRGVKA